MTTTSTQPTASRKGLELTTVFFFATTAALTAGIIAMACHAPTFATMGAGGMSFIGAFTAGMKVIEFLYRSN
ncbi:hypothetical protein [Streptomyces sp. NPDC002722]|uniref:hypothetical protein n=1 Tax=Streptomyces sp. NPDC002722 TaxID=3154425 RepID=UPI003327277A